MAEHKFQYECSQGHGHATNVAVDVCPVTPHGQPCTGTLRRVGAGSRGPRNKADR